MQCVCENIHFVNNIYIYIYVYMNVYSVFNRVHKLEQPKNMTPQEVTALVTANNLGAVSLETVSDHRKLKVLQTTRVQ
jgi:hypothetical protein